MVDYKIYNQEVLGSNLGWNRDERNEERPRGGNNGTADNDCGDSIEEFVCRVYSGRYKGAQ
ncbi:hypothetical protein QJS10_CPB15g00975 [Acorus calamus]|uniref:Uncharacterized protein n=1 Tax=Acorus calamus TaxID=4465 RepID=A0AAV9D775_ACOCL|nr:hypothetical protein QJS10_CPB15g00975 [Acorus calamus]